MESKNIMIVGVGGQGTLLASKLLGRILLENADRCCRLCHSTGPNLIRNGEDWFCSACAARIKAL